MHTSKSNVIHTRTHTLINIEIIQKYNRISNANTQYESIPVRVEAELVHTPTYQILLFTFVFHFQQHFPLLFLSILNKY